MHHLEWTGLPSHISEVRLVRSSFHSVSSLVTVRVLFPLEFLYLQLHGVKTTISVPLISTGLGLTQVL